MIVSLNFCWFMNEKKWPSVKEWQRNHIHMRIILCLIKSFLPLPLSQGNFPKFSKWDVFLFVFACFPFFVLCIVICSSVNGLHGALIKHLYLKKKSCNWITVSIITRPKWCYTYCNKNYKLDPLLLDSRGFHSLFMCKIKMSPKCLFRVNTLILARPVTQTRNHTEAFRTDVTAMLVMKHSIHFYFQA